METNKSKMDEMIEHSTEAGEGVVFTTFSIPAMKLKAKGNESPATLEGMARLYREVSASLFKTGREKLDGIFLMLEAFASMIGKQSSETAEQYCARVATYENNGTVVKVPVSVAFSATLKATLRGFLGGSFNVLKGKEFSFSAQLLKLADGETTDKAVDGEYGEQFLFHVKVVAMDAGKDSKVKWFYEMLSKAVRAVLVEKDEPRAIGIVDDMAKRMQVKPAVVQEIVQLAINAQVGRMIRTEANKLEDSAKAKRQAEIAERLDAGRMQAIHAATSANAVQASAAN